MGLLGLSVAPAPTSSYFHIFKPSDPSDSSHELNPSTLVLPLTLTTVRAYRAVDNWQR